MPAIDFLNHLLNFAAPAMFVALLLAVVARMGWPQKVHVLPWYLTAGLNALLGILVLALGLVLTGQDARIGTYVALVFSMGSCQFLLLRAGN